MAKKNKPIDFRSKPPVDLDAIEQAKIAEEQKANDIIKKLDTPPKKEDPTPPVPPTPPKVEEPPKAQEINWQEKAKSSAQETLILKAKVEQLEAEKTKKVEITDEYLKEKYPDWEDMTFGEQKALRLVEIQAQEIQEIKNNTNKFNNDREWQEKVESWVNDELPDQFPLIVGREEEFKRFATRPTRKGLPLDVIAQSFLYEFPPVVPDKKKNLFHAPGGQPPEPKSDGITAEEAAELMRTKPLQYMRLVREKKLKIKVE